MNKEQARLAAGLVGERIVALRRLIAVQESLSVPCPAGTWRWADVKTSGYARKPEEELAADRARAAQRAARYREELLIAEGAYRSLTAPVISATQS